MSLYVPPVEVLRREVSPAAVLLHFGVRPDPDGRFLCPFHSDREHPNLVCLPPTDEHAYHGFYCNACGERGDAVDMARRVGGLSFGAAQRLCSDLRSDPPSDLPVLEKRDVKPSPSWEARVEECRQRAWEHADAGLVAYAAGFDADPTLSRWLVSDWGWGLTEDATVTVPHRDPDGALTGVKLRDRERRFRVHGRLPWLYGCWRNRPGLTASTLLVLEGESDTVWADWTMRDAGRPDVVGVPSGAHSWSDSWLPWLSGYDLIVTCFDGDDAGWDAADEWQRKLRSLAVRMSPGEDLRSSGLTDGDLMDLIRW